MSDKKRIVALQKQLTIARRALDQIGNGFGNQDAIANDALEEIHRLDAAPGLQGLVGHGANVR